MALNALVAGLSLEVLKVDKQKDSPGIHALQYHSMSTWPRQDQMG